MSQNRVARSPPLSTNVNWYQVVYDKRIILDKGVDTISFGYHWTRSGVGAPVSTVSVAPSLKITEHMLFSLIHPSTGQGACHQDPNPVNDNGDIGTNCGEIFLTTDEESDMDYESENYQDRTFVDDG